MTTKAFLLDDLDSLAVNAAITAFQQNRLTGTMPDSDSDLPGAILAEICRGWMELHGWWPPKSLTADE